MKEIHTVYPEDFVNYDTKEIRDKFLLESWVQTDKIDCVYTHHDRMIIGATCPVDQSLQSGPREQSKADHFPGRHEIGIIRGNPLFTD